MTTLLEKSDLASRKAAFVASLREKADAADVVAVLLEKTTGAANMLHEAAWCVEELDRRGYDWSRFRDPLVPLLRGVASGALLPELMLKCGQKLSRLKALAALPSLTQEKIVGDGCKVPLLVPGKDGELSMRLRDVDRMSDEEFSRAVGQGKLHGEESQRAEIDRERTEAMKPLPSVAAGGRARIDRERAVAEMRAGVYTVEELEAIVAVLRGKRPRC